MGNLSHLKQAKVVYAFPGHGKTPFAKQHIGPWMDLDFGLIRTAFRVEKEKEKVLYKPYARLLSSFVDEGFKILSNAPETIPYVKSALPGSFIVMVLPKDPTYSAKKLGVSLETAEEWIKGWSETAERNKIPIYWTDRSFDNFMRRLVY